MDRHTTPFTLGWAKERCWHCEPAPASDPKEQDRPETQAHQMLPKPRKSGPDSRKRPAWCSPGFEKGIGLFTSPERL